jgi:hypothetical protein
MPSQLKSDTARANGAKSRGPKTPETRAISSQNAVTHGFTACHTTLLKCENAAEFEETIASHFATYKPANPAQENLVNDMISAHWRIRRLHLVETQLVDLEMIRNRAEVDKTFTHPDANVHLAEGFRTLIEHARTLSHLSRYESRLYRIHDRAYRTLRELQIREPHREDLCASLESGPSPQPAIEPAPPPESQEKNEETNPPCALSQRLLRPSIVPQSADYTPVPLPPLLAATINRLAKRKRLHRL